MSYRGHLDFPSAALEISWYIQPSWGLGSPRIETRRGTYSVPRRPTPGLALFPLAVGPDVRRRFAVGVSWETPSPLQLFGTCFGVLGIHEYYQYSYSRQSLCL